MKYYNSLRKTNPELYKTRTGRKIIMKEACFMAKINTTMNNVEKIRNSLISFYNAVFGWNIDFDYNKH